MRVILIEPLLKNQQGHIFFCIRAMTAGLKRRGIPCIIFGNLSAENDALEIGDFFPSFSEITVAVLKTGIFPKGLLFLPGLIRKFKKQLFYVLTENPGFSIQKDDVIFSNSLHIFEFAVLGWFLYAKGKTLAEKGCKAIIGFNFSNTRNSRLLTILLSFAYKMICRYWIDKSHMEVSYFSSADLIKQEFEKLINKKVYFFPTPVYPLPAGQREFTADAEDPLQKDRIKVSYLGGARYNKGFDLYVKMVECLEKEELTGRKIFFLVHVDIHEQQSRNDINAVKKSVALLEGLAGQNSNIKIIYGTLPAIEYYRLLLLSDVVVLPYRDRVYHHGSSNIFIETIIAGKVPIVSSDTVKAADLSCYQLGDLIFKNGDAPDLLRVMKQALSGYEIYRERIKKMQEDFIRFHNVENLVDTLLKV